MEVDVRYGYVGYYHLHVSRIIIKHVGNKQVNSNITFTGLFSMQGKSQWDVSRPVEFLEKQYHYLPFIYIIY